jgi:ABC-type nitrate/sulfonate/bicarbonate transport system substrate-binding protein
MTLTRRTVLLSTLLVSLISAGAPAAAQALQEVSIGLASTSFATAAPRLAKEMGLFEKRGLDAKFTVLDSANAATAALIAKSVDYAISGPGEIVAAHARNQPVVALANGYVGFSGTVVIAKSVADKLGSAATTNTAARLKALDGLLIASPSATGAYTITLKAAAAAVGANVRFTYMGQPAMLAALESGAIQGFIGGAPFWATAVGKGYGSLWLSGPKGEFAREFVPAATVNLQTMRAQLEAQPAVVKRLLDVFNDLGKAVDERPAEVKAALAKLYPTLDAATLDLLFGAEGRAWRAQPLTKSDMSHEIAYMKLGGAPIPRLESLDPAAMLP